MKTNSDLLREKFDVLKIEFPAITFGYIGNCGVDRSGPFDDRSWYIFLPTTGYSTINDRVGGYRTDQLDRMLASWDQIAAIVRRRMLDRGAVSFNAHKEL